MKGGSTIDRGLDHATGGGRYALRASRGRACINEMSALLALNEIHAIRSMGGESLFENEFVVGFLKMRRSEIVLDLERLGVRIYS